jgi:hypothetical protein
LRELTVGRVVIIARYVERDDDLRDLLVVFSGTARTGPEAREHAVVRRDLLGPRQQGRATGPVHAVALCEPDLGEPARERQRGTHRHIDTRAAQYS